MLGLALSPTFLRHDTGPHHPERPDRIAAIHAALLGAGLLPPAQPLADLQIDFGSLPRCDFPLIPLDCAPARTRWLLSVHTPRHVLRVRRVCAAGGGVLDLGDTPVSRDSYDTALLAVGAVLQCCDAVVEGRVRRAFAAVRPPGHHAEPDRAMGFCLFNNVAIAARYLQRQYKLTRIAIVDFDVHHGNGTQAAFADDPSVLFISLHQHPRTCYPGSGYDWEIGSARGRGFTVNIPLEPGCGDQEYLKILDSRVVPELDEFAPQMLLISAGFDAHGEDPLAQMQLSEEGYELMTRGLTALAERHCGGKIVSVLEGGYNLRALGRCVLRHLRGMSQT